MATKARSSTARLPVLRASVTADSLTSEGDAATILIDGADTACTANGLANYAPTPGDRLLVMRVGAVVEVMQFLSRGTVPWSGGSGSGVSVYRQDSAPTGTIVTGSLWYDSDDDDHPYRWDGTSWVDVRDGAIATAQSAADAAQSTADSAASDASDALTDVATKTTSTTSTAGPSGTPGDGDEWAVVDANGVVIARYYGTGGDWAPTEVGPDWLASNLELASHVVAPKHTNQHDWTVTPSTLTLGTVSDTGGSLDGTTYKYQYYVEALLSSGLYAPLSNASDFGQPTTATGTVAISWTAVSGAVSYRVWRWRWPLAGGLIQEGYRTVTGATSYTDTSDTGWTTSSNLPTVTGNARVDLNPDGLFLYDDENARTVMLFNSGGFVVSGQINFATSPDDLSDGEVLVAQGPSAAAAYPSGEAKIIDHQLFDNGHFVYTVDATDEDSGWEVGIYAGSGDERVAIWLSKATDSDFNPTMFLDASRIEIGNTVSGNYVEFINPQNVRGIHRAGDIKWTSDPAYPSGDGFDGWIIADGSALSRTGYATLFDVIGTTYGAGDGSTTFNIPDLRNRVAIGAGSTYAAGTTGGAATHTLTTAEMPSHTHGNGSLTVGLEYATTTSTGGTATRVTDIANTTGGAGTNATANIGGSTGSAGSGDSFSILNPYMALTPLIFIGQHDY